MKKSLKRMLVFALAGFLGATGRAQTLDAIGVTVLRAVTTNLNGTGIRVGQPEGNATVGQTNYEVNPSVAGQPTNFFTYIYGTSPYLTVSTSTNFPNALGIESGHADTVANNFYGTDHGVATNVAHVDNYEANTFVYYYIGYVLNNPHSISERIVNQSFTFGSVDTTADQDYDNYAAQNSVLFISGAGFLNTNVWSPATCYNGMGVGVSDYSQPTYGPTPDGRSKPDIVAPHYPDYSTSYAAPQVAGAAAVLMQAGLRGDGGGDTNSAVDIRTLKALLLNGAVKPAGWTNVIWTNGTRLVLDTNYGAGVLNVFNTYKQLAGGKHGYNFSTNVPAGTPHPPVVMTNAISVWSGWDFNTNTSSGSADAVSHYFFNLTNSVSNATFTATTTLVWNRQSGQASINNLNLFFYKAANSNLVACSTSLVDNVEHIFVPKLAPGRYDLQVLKKGGSFVSAGEPYALAWEFFTETLNASKSGTNVVLSWPVFPDGFHVEATANLSAPNWSASGLPSPVVTNNRNMILLNAANAPQFFRLRTP